MCKISNSNRFNKLVTEKTTIPNYFGILSAVIFHLENFRSAMSTHKECNIIWSELICIMKCFFYRHFSSPNSFNINLPKFKSTFTSTFLISYWLSLIPTQILLLLSVLTEVFSLPFHQTLCGICLWPHWPWHLIQFVQH